MPGRWELAFDTGYADQCADLPTGQTLIRGRRRNHRESGDDFPTVHSRDKYGKKLTEADMEAVLDHNGKSVLRERLEWPDIVILKRMVPVLLTGS